MIGRNRQRYIPRCLPPKKPFDGENDPRAACFSRLSEAAPTGPALDLLEQLDDVIFDAIRGCTTSLAKAEQLWPKTVARLGWEGVEESREQYLRYARDVTCHPEGGGEPTGLGPRSPERGLVVLEVIELLMRREF